MALTRSPFPPIADYAFLSNCHTGALGHLSPLEVPEQVASHITTFITAA